MAEKSKKYPLVGSFKVTFPALVKKSVTVKEYDTYALLQVLTVTGLLVQQVSCKNPNKERIKAFMNLFDGENKIINIDHIIPFGENYIKNLKPWGAIRIGFESKKLNADREILFDTPEIHDTQAPFRVYKYRRNDHEHSIFFTHDVVHFKDDGVKYE